MNQRKSFWLYPTIFFLSLFLIPLSIRPALAQSNTLPARQDSYTDRNSPAANFNGNTLAAGYDNFGAFNPSTFSYLQFDLAGVSSPAHRAVITLTVVSNNSNAANVTLSLYAVESDDWNAATLTHNNRPPTGPLLQSVTIAGNYLGPVQFGDAAVADHPVGLYLESQRSGDKIASLLLQVQSATTPGFFGILLLEDEEGSFDGLNGNEPRLLPNPGDPTAINLSHTQVGLITGNRPLPALITVLALLTLITGFLLHNGRFPHRLTA